MASTSWAEKPKRPTDEEIRQAAERGDIFAIRRAALRAGRNGDFAEMAYWYRRGAELGDADSQWNYASRLLEGKGVARDDKEAFRWVIAAASTLHPYANLVAAEMYAAGQGTARDPLAALAHVELALRRLQDSEADAHVRASALRKQLERELSPSQIEEAQQRRLEILRRGPVDSPEGGLGASP